jgi:PKD repeat protein
LRWVLLDVYNRTNFHREGEGGSRTMVERILISVLIPALILLTFPQLGAQTNSGSEIERQLMQTVQHAFQGQLLGTKSAENELFTFTRSAPDQVAPGDVFTITETLQAKDRLEFAAIVSELPQGFELVSGDLRAFQLNGLSPGEELTNSYDVKAPSDEGTFTFSANARAKPQGGESQGVSVDLTISVQEGAPPPPPPPPPPQENIPPIAVFSYSPLTPLVGDTVTFDGSGSTDPDGTVVDYRWNLGDGTVLTGPDKAIVTHVYEQPGTYSVQLVVVDDKGDESSPRSLSITVEKPPEPTIFGVPVRTAIIVGAVVGGLIVGYLLLRALRGAVAPAEEGPGETAISGERITSILQPEIERFLASTELPLSDASSMSVVETVDELTRARWVRTLAERSLIALLSQDGTVTFKSYKELSAQEQANLDLSALGEDSLITFISQRVAPGDTIVRITWTMESGETVESSAVVDAEQGQLKFDTLMSLEGAQLTFS